MGQYDRLYIMGITYDFRRRTIMKNLLQKFFNDTQGVPDQEYIGLQALVNLHEEIFEYVAQYFQGDMDLKQLSPDRVERFVMQHSDNTTNYRLTHVYNDSIVTDEIINRTQAMVIVERCSIT